MNPRRIYLVQTDTTVGFLSQDAARLARIKGRTPTKPFLIAVASLAQLRNFARVPVQHRKLVRRAKRTTFVYPNGRAVRYVGEGEHRKFLQKFGWMYSTSANPSGGEFDEAWARKQADIVVEDKRGFFESPPSRIIKLGRKKLLRLR